MSREEFLELLERTPRDWRLAAGRIRRGTVSDPDCPLSAVAREASRGHHTGDAAAEPKAGGLDLAPDLVDAILAASDNLDQADPSLRMSLLEACGLLVRRESAALRPPVEPSLR